MQGPVEQLGDWSLALLSRPDAVTPYGCSFRANAAVSKLDRCGRS